MGYNREANENPRTMVVPGLEEILDVASFAAYEATVCSSAAQSVTSFATGPIWAREEP